MKQVFTLAIAILTITLLNAQQNPEGLFINSKAPDFKGKNQNNEEVRLKDLLKKGKVVLVFYRGQWCPYCNRQLSKLEDSLQLILDKGAQLVAISPEKPESILKTIEKTKAHYPILYDKDLKIMKAYDVAFEVPENTLKRYMSSGLDVIDNNGTNGKYLPVPAVYIINQQMDIIYRFFDTDYRKRPSVQELLSNL